MYSTFILYKKKKQSASSPPQIHFFSYSTTYLLQQFNNNTFTLYLHYTCNTIISFFCGNQSWSSTLIDCTTPQGDAAINLILCRCTCNIYFDSGLFMK